jgi:putative transposase
MPRQVRIEYEGAIYHVMCRGDRQEAIFEDDEDRERFLKTLGEVVGRTGWLIHAYVLMGNHYHLLIETPEANLVRGMTWFQTTCTVRHNARHRCSGHLFAGRYKAILVDPEQPAYFHTLWNYIHLNPVRAGVVRLNRGESLLDYAWSSLSGYVLLRRRPKWLCVERGLATLQREDRARDRKSLLREIESFAQEEEVERSGLSTIEGQSLQSTVRRGWYFGSEAFREWLLEKADETIGGKRKKRQNYHGAEIREHGEAEARRMIARLLKEEGLRRKDLGKLAKSDERKVTIARAIRSSTSAPLKMLAEELKMGTPMNVSRLTSERR